MPNLKEYVQDGLKKGYSKQELRKILKDSDYSKAEIDAAFNASKTSKVQTTSLNYFEKIKTLFLHPKQFFDLVEGEKSYGDIFLFFLIIFIIIETIGFFISLSVFSISIIIVGIVKLIFLSSIASVIGIIIILGMIHLGVLILGGREGVFNSFKPIVYTYAVIGLFYSFIRTIIFGIWDRINPLSIDQQLTLSLSPSFESIPKARLIVVLFILIIGLIHGYYILTTGISKFQKMSKTKAFLSIIIIPLGVLLIWLLLGFLLDSRLGGPGVYNTKYCLQTLEGRCTGVDINGEPNPCQRYEREVPVRCNKGEGYCCRYV